MDPSTPDLQSLVDVSYEFTGPDRAAGDRLALSIATDPDTYPLIPGAGDEAITINGRITRAELIRIAENLEIASDPADHSTWFDPGVAFP